MQKLKDFLKNDHISITLNNCEVWLRLTKSLMLRHLCEEECYDYFDSDISEIYTAYLDKVAGPRFYDAFQTCHTNYFSRVADNCDDPLEYYVEQFNIGSYKYPTFILRLSEDE